MLRLPLVSLLLAALPAAPGFAQQYDCVRLEPDRKTTVPYPGIEFSADELTLETRETSQTAKLVEMGKFGRVYIAEHFVFVVFGPDEAGSSQDVFGLGPLDIIALYRDPVAPDLAELSCLRAKK